MLISPLSTPPRQAFPQHLSSSQLSHALSTVIACLSDLDDARAYHVIERLEREIGDTSPSAGGSAAQGRRGGGAGGKRKKGELSFEPPAAPPQTPAQAPSPAQLAGEKLLDTQGDNERGAEEAAQRVLQLQLAYIDALPYVNLVLLRSVLSRVRGYILDARAAEGNSRGLLKDGEEGKGELDAAQMETQAELGGEEGEGSPHLQLCRRTFKALNGMDDTARQEGVRWWLECREEFGV